MVGQQSSGDTRAPGEGKGRKVLVAVRVVVAVGLLAALFMMVPLGRIGAELRAARLELLAVAAGLALLGICTSSLKLWLLVRTAHSGARWSSLTRAYYVGTFFNNFLPTGAGGDVMKVNEMRRMGVPLGHATACAVVERGLGVAVVMALAAALALGGGRFLARLRLEAVRWPLAAVSLGGSAVLAALYAAWLGGLKSAMKSRRDGKVLGRLYRVIESFYVFRNKPWTIAGALALSVLFYGIMAVNIWTVVLAVGGRITLSESAGIVPLRTLPDVLPISIGSLGVREGMVTYCLAGLGLTPARAAAAALSLRLLVWLHSAAGGCLYALARKGGSG